MPSRLGFIILVLLLVLVPHVEGSVWSEDGKTLHGVAVRTEQWRYAEFGKDGINGAMLFDPHADSFEMKNLANDEKHKPVVAELSALTRKYAATLDAA